MFFCFLFRFFYFRFDIPDFHIGPEQAFECLLTGHGLILHHLHCLTHKGAVHPELTEVCGESFVDSRADLRSFRQQFGTFAEGREARIFENAFACVRVKVTDDQSAGKRVEDYPPATTLVWENCIADDCHVVFFRGSYERSLVGGMGRVSLVELKFGIKLG